MGSAFFFPKMAKFPGTVAKKGLNAPRWATITVFSTKISWLQCRAYNAFSEFQLTTCKLAKVVISQTESTLITVNVLANTPGDVTVAISGFLASYISPSLFKNSSMYTLECQIIKKTPLKMPVSCMTQHNVKNKCKDVKQLRSQCNKPNTCQAFK